MLLGLLAVIYMAAWAALLWWHGTIDGEQAAEAQRLEEWARQLCGWQTRVPYDQEADW